MVDIFTPLYGIVVIKVFLKASWYAKLLHISEVKSEYLYLKIFAFTSCWWFYTNLNVLFFQLQV